MEKYINLVDKWIFVLHISVTILFNTLFVAAFFLGNSLFIYALAAANSVIMIWNIVNMRKIFMILLEDLKKWELAATYDSLTNVLNRGIFIQNLNREIQRSHRYNLDMSYIIFDLDYFKKINDTYGHHTGDLVLIKVCEKIKHIVRNVDFFGRLGGEEFGIIMPETNIENAKILAERIRITTEKIKIKEGLVPTISIGLTALKENDDIDSIYERADNALYKSKEDGRNRMTIV